jgi:hypothetical protein
MYRRTAEQSVSAALAAFTTCRPASHGRQREI